eukprot:3765664-Rhodomonas_salina.2
MTWRDGVVSVAAVHMLREYVPRHAPHVGADGGGGGCHCGGAFKFEGRQHAVHYGAHVLLGHVGQRYLLSCGVADKMGIMKTQRYRNTGSTARYLYKRAHTVSCRSTGTSRSRGRNSERAGGSFDLPLGSGTSTCLLSPPSHHAIADEWRERDEEHRR